MRQSLLLVCMLIAVCGECLSHTSQEQPATKESPPAPKGLEGKWQGTLGEGARKLRLVLTITKTAEGAFSGTLDSVDQGARLPMENIMVTRGAVRFEVKPVGGVYEGVLRIGQTEMSGTWTQTRVPTQPLTFKRASDAAPSRQGTSMVPRPAQKPFTTPLDIAVPISPVAFKADGKWHLVYELHVTNFDNSDDCTLRHLDVVTGDRAHKLLASFSGAELQGLVTRPAQPGVTEKSKLGPGTFAIVYLWVTLDKREDVPAVIRHRVSLKVVEYPEEVTVETPPTPVDREPVVVISTPLRGGEWLAANGPSNTSIHRRALGPFDGRACSGQRFAIDWLQLYAEGKSYKGDPADNKNYRAYGAEIHAVADGIVTEVKDGIPENIPGMSSRAVPITMETVAGNHVIVHIGSNLYAVYVHMQPGSVRVGVGEKVRRGQVLGLLGNSGNSTEPHLHFQICNANSVLSCEGLPYAFSSFEVQGHGWGWVPRESRDAPARHTMEIPTDGEVVKFSSPE